MVTAATTKNVYIQHTTACSIEYQIYKIWGLEDKVIQYQTSCPIIFVFNLKHLCVTMVRFLSI